MDDNVEAAPSADNGNVPVDLPETPVAPSEPATPETPAETVETATPAEPEVELFELPDGRKVDAETLSKEWKENFYPDYTRKSQALAAKEKPLETPPQSKYADPNYVPQTYEEIIQAAKQAALEEMESKERARVEAQQALENTIATQLAEVKKADPQLNENALFLHATKYGFRDLKQAHQNMRDMSEMAKKVQANTAKDIAKRNDPVSASPGATGVRPDPSNFSTARDYLRSLK